MFGRYKKSKTDFDLLALPMNRKEQFFTFLKNDKMTIFKISLVFLLFLIPYFTVVFVQRFTMMSLDKMVDNGEITAADRLYSIALNDLMFNGIKIVALAIFAIGLAGILRVLRNLAWNEGVFFMDDFKKGIKANYKQCFFPCLIIGLSIFLYYVFLDFTSYSGNVILLIGLILFCGLCVLFIFPICLFWFSQASCYEGKTSLFFTNTLTLIFVRYLSTLLFSILFVGLFFINLIYNSIIFYCIVFIVILFVIPLLTVVFHLYSLSIFDQYINITDKKYLFKGLYKNKMDL